MKKKKGKLLSVIGSVLILTIAAIHIPKYNTALWIGSDESIESLIGQDSSDFSDSEADLKIEIGGEIVYQTNKADFSRYQYTRKDILLRAGFHKIKISSDSMNIYTEKICYTLFDYYVAIELFSPSGEGKNDRVFVWSGFMPVRFM